MRQRIFLLVLTGMVWLTLPSHAQAATYWVSKSASGTGTTCFNSATEPANLASQSRLTINAGLQCLAPGDTLIIKAGTYSEVLLNVIPSGISDTQRTIIKSALGETVNITGTTSQFMIDIVDRNFITLDRLTIDGGPSPNSNGVVIRGAVSRSTYITIINCTIKNHGGPGSDTNGCINQGGDPGHHHYFGYNTMTNCGDHNGEHGVYLVADDSIVEHNVITDAFSHGIHEYHSSIYAPERNTLRYNVVSSGQIGIGMYTGSNSVAYNNIVYNNTVDAFRLGGSNYKIYNNTIYNNSGYAFYNNAGGHDIANNILFQNGALYLTTSGITIRNNLSTNPSFINAPAANFRLQSGSSAINAGISTAPTVTTDFDGVIRPQPAGGAYDIGAFEFVSSGADTTPPLVVSRTPASGATGVPLSTTVTVVFNEAMNAATITTSTILLQSPGPVTVPASVSYNAGTITATLTPTSPLSTSTVYTITAESGASGVKDVAGNALVTDATSTFTTAAPVTPLTYHVAKTGSPASDSNSCTAAQNPATPKLTINAGIDCLVSGDTLIVHAGTYDERIRENGVAIPSGTSDSQRTIIQAATGETVWLMPTTNLAVFQILGRNFITIDGINMDSASAGATSAFGLLIGNGAESIIIKNLTIKNVQGTAGLADGAQTCLSTQDGDGGTGHQFINLDIENCGTGADEHGISLSSINSVIENCRVRDAGAHGIFISPHVSTPNTNVIRNNAIYGNADAGLGIYTGTGNQAYNNIVYGNGSNGIRLNSVNTLVYNNTVYDNGAVGISFTGGTTNTLRNNIAYQNTGGEIGSTAGHTASNNLTTNPLFVNTATADFHLQTGSAAIDTGTSTAPTVTTDFDDVDRPQGVAYDIGAFEFTGPPTPPPPTQAPGAPTGVTIQ